MSKALTLEKPKTNLEAVTRYMIKGDIVLSADQEELLQRLSFIDDKLRSRKSTRDEVVNMSVARFKISKWRAEQDITDTHRLFGQTRKLDKTYVLSVHIEEIERQIQLAKEMRRLELLPKLNDSLTYALNSLPSEEREINKQSVQIIFVNNKAQPADMKTIDELMLETNILMQETDDEFIDFEDEP